MIGFRNPQMADNTEGVTELKQLVNLKGVSMEQSVARQVWRSQHGPPYGGLRESSPQLEARQQLRSPGRLILP